MRNHFVKSTLINTVAATAINITLFQASAFSQNISEPPLKSAPTLIQPFQNACKNIYASTLELIDNNHFFGKTKIPQTKIVQHALQTVRDQNDILDTLPPADVFTLLTYANHCQYLQAPLIELSHMTGKPIEDLLATAVNGAIRLTRDQNTRYEPPATAEISMMKIEGFVMDVGIKLDILDGKMIVVSIATDNPAYAQGVRAGDYLLEVNKQKTNKLSTEDVIELIKNSKEGIEIEFKSPHKAKPQSTRIKKIKREDNPVTARLIGDIAYIKLERFSEIAAKKIIEATDKLHKQAVKLKLTITKAVLDLRKNPGGRLNQARYVSDFYVHSTPLKQSSPPILYSAGSIKNSSRVYADTGSSYTTRYYFDRFHILIDEQSASASEIVAGAVQDNKAGTIIGVPSYGKSSIQTLYKGDDPGSEIIITTETSIPGGYKTVHCSGVIPDIYVNDGKWQSRSKRHLCGKDSLQIPIESTRADQTPQTTCSLKEQYRDTLKPEIIITLPNYLVQKTDDDTKIGSIKYEFDAILTCSLLEMGVDMSEYVEMRPYIPAPRPAQAAELNMK